MVYQVLSLLRHEVTIEINLSDDLVRDLDGLELRVSEAGLASEAVSLTRYFFDKYHRPSTALMHMLNITNGHYDLRFTIQKSTANEAIVVTRTLDVSGAAQVSYHLP
jgi:hypothetical protein